MVKGQQKRISNGVKKKVLVFGKFDILHPGHMQLLKAAKNLGEVTVVLEADDAMDELHDCQVCQSAKIRQKNLEKLGFKIYLRTMDTKANQILQDLKPDILCLGEDQKFLQKSFKDFPTIKIVPSLKKELFRSSRLNAVIQDDQAGIYLIDKPKDTHSFRVVSVTRKILDIKKVGFSGTLDPLASGLLIVATGKATRLLDWFHFLPKVYLANITFGQTSDTYDLEGEVKENKEAKKFSKSDLEKELNKFLGKQSQQAPIFSAKKVAGQKLHKLARQGRAVQAPSKEIEIYDLKIKKFQYPHLELEVSCSAGTYIRSLAHDLGQAMQTGALLSDLRRTAIGQWSVKQALELEKVENKSLKKQRFEPQAIIDSLNQWFFQ